MINISKETTEKLKSKLKGQIILPSDLDYDQVREIWNAMIDRRPALIVRCAEADDVPQTTAFARENGLEISIRGAGHNIAGNALCDNGVTIDFSTMRNVRDDAQKKRAYVEPGATLADFDEVAQSYGLATPVGINSTGIAGLTLGGGFGWLTRKYGMTVDNLISVEVVTAPSGVRIMTPSSIGFLRSRLLQEREARCDNASPPITPSHKCSEPPGCLLLQ